MILSQVFSITVVCSLHLFYIAQLSIQTLPIKTHQLKTLKSKTYKRRDLSHAKFHEMRICPRFQDFSTVERNACLRKTRCRT